MKAITDTNMKAITDTMQKNKIILHPTMTVGSKPYAYSPVPAVGVSIFYFIVKVRESKFTSKQLED